MLTRISQAGKALLYMVKRSRKKVHSELDRPDQVFEVAVELFKLLSAPMTAEYFLTELICPLP